MKKNLLVVICLIYLPLLLPAQPQNDSVPTEWNFFRQRELRNRFIETEIADTTKDNERIKLKWWERFWSNRIDRSGDMRTYPKIMKSHFERIQERVAHGDNCQTDCNSSCFQSNWCFLGPEYLNKQTLGKVHALWVDPNNQDHVLAGSEGGLWKTTDGGLNWQNLTDFCLPGVGIFCITVQPNDLNTIYVGTGVGVFMKSEHGYGYGIYKSTDGGATWQPLNVDASLQPTENFCTKIIIHPGFNSNVYAIIGSRVYKSVNFGSSWQLLFGNPTGVFAITPIPNPDNLVLRDIEINPQITAYDEVYLSSKEHIADWSCSGSFPPCTYFCWGGIKRVTAKVWTFNSSFNTLNATSPVDLCSTIPGYSNETLIAMLSLTPTSLNIACQTLSGIRIFRKIGNGSWTTVNPNITCSGLYGFNSTFSFPFAVSPVNDNILYLGGYQMFKSTNGGNNFACCWGYWDWLSNAAFIGSHPDVRDFILYQANAAGTDMLYLGTDGGVSKTNDGCLNTLNLNGANLQLTQFYGISNSEKFPNLIYGGSQDNGAFSNAATNWQFNVIGDAYDAVSDLDNHLIAYTTSNGSAVYKTTTGGTSWSWLGCPPGENCVDKPLWIDNQNRLYIGAKNLWRRDGSNWTQITNFSNGNNTIRSIKMTDNGNTASIVYGGELWDGVNPSSTFSGKVYKVTNLNTATPFATDLTSGLDGIRWTSITDVAIEPLLGDKIWVCFSSFWESNKKVFQYENNMWTEYGQGLPNIPSNALEYLKDNNDLLFIGTDDGIYYRTRDMAAWDRFSCELPRTIISDLEVNYNLSRLRAATYGRGIWESPIPKLYAPTCIVPATISTNLGSMVNGQTLNILANIQAVSVNYSGTCAGGSCCTPTNISWTIYRRQIFPGVTSETTVASGNISNISFVGTFETGWLWFRKRYQYRVEIKHNCGGKDCGTINLFFKGV